MNFFQLPPGVLLAVFSYLAGSEAYPEHGRREPSQETTCSSFNVSQTTFPASFSATSGTGAAYATACAEARTDYDKQKSSWDAIHNSVEVTTQPVGGTSYSKITYYENATTLCDGHPRVTYSPAKSLSEGWATVTAPVTGGRVATYTHGVVFPAPSPSCQVNPDDCDGLWSGYSKEVAAAATITPPPAIPTPFCMNQTAASSFSKVSEQIYGCGPCTIFGVGVELVYFPVPTTVSRDMCATTPIQNLTSYGPGAVITAYAGKNFGADEPAPTNGVQTAVFDGHTFTTGTAYISISSVYAVDRCSKTFGSVVTDAILAMPSESVLSLRYSQDHFQRVQTTDQITGYPVSYADFNNPIPYSGWIGQNICNGPQDDFTCGVIYENNFRPQLAIPPGIRDLSPDFEGCQMWYNGLWDPPLALTRASSAAGPTLPHGYTPPKTTDAQPSQTPAAPTSRPTAQANELPSSTTQQTQAGKESTVPTVATGSKASPAPSYGSSDGHASNNPATSSSTNTTSGGNGHASNPSGTGNTGSHESGPGSSGGKTTYVPSTEPWSKGFTIDGEEYTATGSNGKVVIGGTVTCVANGPAQTLADGTVCSYGDTGLVIELRTTIIFDTPATVTRTAVQATQISDNIDAAETTESSAPSDNTTDNNNYGANPTLTGDIDTVTITVNGEVETLVQSQDGGPVVIDGTFTLTPGGQPTSYPDGEYIRVAEDGSGVVIGSTSTLGAEEPTTTSAATSTNADGSISGAICSGIGSCSGGGSSAASTTGADNALQTGGAVGRVPAFAAFNVAAVIAIVATIVLV